jgi:hypothetical protein
MLIGRLSALTACEVMVTTGLEVVSGGRRAGRMGAGGRVEPLVGRSAQRAGPPLHDIELLLRQEGVAFRRGVALIWDNLFVRFLWF